MDEWGVALRSRFADQVDDLQPPPGLLGRVRSGARARRRRAVLVRSAGVVVAVAVAVGLAAGRGVPGGDDRVPGGSAPAASRPVPTESAPTRSRSAPTTRAAFVFVSRTPDPTSDLRVRSGVEPYELRLLPEALEPFGGLEDAATAEPSGPASMTPGVCQRYGPAEAAPDVDMAAVFCVHPEGPAASDLERAVRQAAGADQVVQRGTVDGRPAYAVVSRDSAELGVLAVWTGLYFQPDDGRTLTVAVRGEGLRRVDFQTVVAGLHRQPS